MLNYRHGRPTIGVLAGWHAYEGTLHSFLDQVLRGILAAARDRACNLLLACGVGTGEPGQGRPAWPILSSEFDFVPVSPRNTDGLIATVPFASRTGTPYAMQSRYIFDLIADGFPVVFAGAGTRGSAVIPDNERGIRYAMSHLAAHGHRRIAYIAGVEGELEGDSEIRIRAYKSILREWGLEPDPDLIAFGYHNPAGGRRAMRQILNSGTPFTAVLASNDESAIGAIDVLRDAGLLVPQDIAVIGFDDRLEARAHVPPLTTVHHPMFDLGYQALELLLRRIEGGTKEAEIVHIPTRLVIRESCGCLPGAIIDTDLKAPMPQQSDHQERDRGIARQIVHQITGVVHAEMQRLSRDEIDYLCQRLVDTFRLSLEQGDATIFQLGIQQILQRVSSQGDDLYPWQAAISILRSNLPTLLESWSCSLTHQQAEEMLHQARIAINEVARGQYTRHLLHQADVTDRVGRMSAQFLAAQDETEILDVLAESLPGIGIQHATVVLYEGSQDNPLAWSVLQSSHGSLEKQHRFLSREFPPQGLYSEDEPFSLALLPLSVQEGTSGFVAFDTGNLEPCADIVRQLAAALRGVWLYREAVEGRRLAEEANRLKSRFLSVVSHELRTPLNLISGLSDMLLQEGEQAGFGRFTVSQEDVERIYISAQHLDGLIRDVLDLAQSEVGQLKLVCEPLDLAEVLETVAVIGEQLATSKGLEWRSEIPEALPRVWGDRTRLRQVALNLVNNAVKFTSRGEITLIVTSEDDSITVAVLDTGLGIPPREHEVIFDEFRQSERATARGYGGLGLGLAICKRLVAMHGGEIGVRSSGEDGAGSTFYFTLPTIERQAIFSTAKVSLAKAHQVFLLVRDVEGGELLKSHLVQQGFEVEMHQADEMLDWLSWLLTSSPEAVVLDLGLASERGWEILKILKGNPSTQDIPVLFYTLTQEKDSGTWLEMDYLTKPVGTLELAEALACQGLLSRADEEQADKKILVVDDEPGTLEMHTRIVDAQSPAYQVLQARDGREALETIRREKPDLVLLDLMMPELDGFGVLEAMREEEISRNIPVIVLTGQTLTEDDMTRLNQGVVSVLGKGLFSVAETLEHVEAALARKRRIGSEARRIALKALAYIHTHYAEPVSREDVASYIGLSERHLARCFRREMGVTLSNYINRYRVRQAKALLEAGDKSITEIAMAVGFSDSSYFGRVFRQEVGVSPSAYQQGERRPPAAHDRLSPS